MQTDSKYIETQKLGFAEKLGFGTFSTASNNIQTNIPFIHLLFVNFTAISIITSFFIPVHLFYPNRIPPVFPVRLKKTMYLSLL